MAGSGQRCAVCLPMDDLDLRLAEAWLRLLAEAVRGTRSAQRALRAFAERLQAPAELARRLSTFLPAGVSPPRPEALERWLERFWGVAGLVPRRRYEELLERYEALRARLEDAEVTIRKLRRLLGDRGRERDAKQLLDVWASAVTETLRTQAGWMSRFVPPPGGPRRVHGARSPQGSRPRTSRS